MASANHRNLAIDWLKGWMILCVVLVHTWAFPNCHFYLAVDVFYFIAGYYLMLGFLKKPTTAVQYTWKRIRLIALPFFLCLVVRCLMAPEAFFAPENLDAAIEKYGEFFYTATLAENLGLYVPPERLLVGGWFFSVLVISSFLLYGMLEYNQKLATRILFPLIALIGFNALFQYSESAAGSFFRAGLWSRISVLSANLVRGGSEMAAGALICSVYTEHKASFEKRATFINIMGIISFILFLLVVFAPGNHDNLTVVTIPWILLAAVIDGSWLSKGLSRIRGGIMARVGKYTLYILCVHNIALLLANWCNEHFFHSALQQYGLIVSGVLLVIPATALLYIVCQWIRKHIFKAC